MGGREGLDLALYEQDADNKQQLAFTTNAEEAARAYYGSRCRPRRASPASPGPCRCSPATSTWPAERPWQAWLVLASGVLFVAWLEAFLLLMAGRTSQGRADGGAADPRAGGLEPRGRGAARGAGPLEHRAGRGAERPGDPAARAAPPGEEQPAGDRQPVQPAGPLPARPALPRDLRGEPQPRLLHRAGPREAVPLEGPGAHRLLGVRAQPGQPPALEPGRRTRPSTWSPTSTR